MKFKKTYPFIIVGLVLLLVVLVNIKANAQCTDKTFVPGAFIEVGTISKAVGIGIDHTNSPFSLYAGVKTTPVESTKGYKHSSNTVFFGEIDVAIVYDRTDALQAFVVISPNTLAYGGMWSFRIIDWAGARLKMGIEKQPFVSASAVVKLL